MSKEIAIKNKTLVIKRRKRSKAQNWRNTKEYKNWRKDVIAKKGKCYVCDHIEHLHAHHILCASRYPEKRFSVINGIALCRVCHTLLHCGIRDSYRCKTSKNDIRKLKKIFKAYHHVAQKLPVVRETP